MSLKIWIGNGPFKLQELCQEDIGTHGLEYINLDVKIVCVPVPSDGQETIKLEVLSLSSLQWTLNWQKLDHGPPCDKNSAFRCFITEVVWTPYCTFCHCITYGWNNNENKSFPFLLGSPRKPLNLKTTAQAHIPHTYPSMYTYCISLNQALFVHG